MEIKLEQDITQKELEVLIRYSKMTQTVKNLERLLRTFDKTIVCHSEDAQVCLSVSHIYYVESVDKKTFVYCEDAIYRSPSRLYQLIEELDGFGFVQVSKSCLLNLRMLQSLHAQKNSRLEAVLTNGEKITINRNYISAIKKELTAYTRYRVVGKDIL